MAATIAAVGGALVAPILTPNAKALLLAVALIYAGVAALWRRKAPARLAGWKLGALGTSAVGGGILALGDRTAFVTFALAARGPSPSLAATGAIVGALVLAAIAIASGERGWTRLPLRAISIVAGGLLLATGLVIGVGALRLT